MNRSRSLARTKRRIRRWRLRALPKSVRRAATIFIYFFRAEPLRGCIMLFSMIVAGMLEGIGIAALLPLLDAITGTPESRTSGITRGVTQALTAVGVEPTIGALLTLVVIVITAKALILVFSATQIGYTASNVTMSLRLQLLESLMRARWAFFVRQRMGSISAAMTSEPARAATTYVQIARALTGLLQLVVYTALAVAISIEVSIAAVVVGLASSILLHRFVVLTGKTGQRQTLLTKSLLSALTDGLVAMKPLKAMARERQLETILTKDIVAMNSAQRLQILARESLANYREPITTAALAVGLYIVLTQWNLELESLLVMAFLFLRTVGRISSFQSNLQGIASSLPAYWFVRSVLSTAEKAAEKESCGKPPTFEAAIQLQDVGFAYRKNRPILNDVSVTLPKGRFVAIFGPSGGGKTTIADLVTGLLRPTKGRILVDQTPLSEMDQTAWRRMIGYVPQDTPLLHDTILNNITLRDSAISEAMAIQALRQAGAWTFVQAMPEGVHSVVGERGTRLSGGQRQRVAIARALAHEPTLLILDEATAALDPQTEAEICKVLKDLSGRVTILAISHQNAMRDAADIVYRVENGTVARLHERDGEAWRASAS